MTHYDVRLVTKFPPFRMRVLLDGVEVPYAVAADDQNGWVEHLVTDKYGSVLLFGRGENKHPRTKTIYGTVVFEPMEETE